MLLLDESHREKKMHWSCGRQGGGDLLLLYWSSLTFSLPPLTFEGKAGWEKPALLLYELKIGSGESVCTVLLFVQKQGCLDCVWGTTASAKNTDWIVNTNQEYFTQPAVLLLHCQLSVEYRLCQWLNIRHHVLFNVQYCQLPTLLALGLNHLYIGL